MIGQYTARACVIVTGLLASAALADAASLSVAWDPNGESDIAGYFVHYGTQPGTHPNVVDVGNTTSVAIPNLNEGQVYYFVVQAYSTAGLTSTMSAEVSGVAPVSPANGLVAAFGFEEMSGSVTTDASPAHYTGTLSGATRTADGKIGRALSFDGVNDWVTVPDALAFDLTTGMTIEAWVNPTSLTGWRSVVVKERTGGLAYGLYANDNVPRPAGWTYLGGDVSAVGTVSLPIGAWTHLATTYDGTIVRLFVNGVLVGTQPGSGSLLNTAEPLRIGGNAIWGEYFSGKIDEVRIYNRALSQSEISGDMNSGVVTGLVGAYGFEETTGAATTDASGSGNTGTLSGATRVAAGKFGRALSFDGVNDWVTVPDAATLDGARVTVEAWVYPTSLSGWRVAVIKEAAAGMAYGLYAHDNAPRPAMTIPIAGPDYSALGAAQLALNTWSHLASTYDGTTIRLYVNGVQVGSTAVTGAIAASSSPLRIGGNAVWGEYFSGKIDEVRIYNRALSAAEIAADMDRPVVP